MRARSLSAGGRLLFAPLGDGHASRQAGATAVNWRWPASRFFAASWPFGYSAHFDRWWVRPFPAPHGVSWLITVVYDGGVVRHHRAPDPFGVGDAPLVWSPGPIGLGRPGRRGISPVLIVILGRNGGRPAGAAIEASISAFRSSSSPSTWQWSRCSAVSGPDAPADHRSGRPPRGALIGGRWPRASVSVLGSLAIGWAATAIVHSSSAHHSAFLPLMMSMRCSLSCQSEPVRFGHWRSRPGGGHLPRHGDQRKGRRI